MSASVRDEHNWLVVRFRLDVNVDVDVTVRAVKSKLLEFKLKDGMEKREVDRRASEDCCIVVTEMTPAEAANAAA